MFWAHGLKLLKCPCYSKSSKIPCNIIIIPMTVCFHTNRKNPKINMGQKWTW